MGFTYKGLKSNKNRRNSQFVLKYIGNNTCRKEMRNNSKVFFRVFNVFVLTLFVYTIYFNNSKQKLKFVEYKSSKLEHEWLNIIKLNNHNSINQYCILIKPFYKRLQTLQNDINKCKNHSYNKCQGDDLSFFIYKYSNGKILQEYIEPLFGILRNTFSICNKNKKGNIVSKDYLLPSYKKVLEKPIIYLDAGASTFYTGAGGASQYFFYKYYKDYPLTRFKKWFLWEVKKYNITNIMKEVPTDIFEIYNYFNKPISTDINSDDNPLKIIKKYQKEFYIIFKLDVDNPNVELPILNYLINKNDIIPDEFYFEYHFYSQIMMKSWRKKVDFNCSLYCATNKFLYLRKKGIRCHAWV